MDIWAVFTLLTITDTAINIRAQVFARPCCQAWGAFLRVQWLGRVGLPASLPRDCEAVFKVAVPLYVPTGGPPGFQPLPLRSSASGCFYPPAPS